MSRRATPALVGLLIAAGFAAEARAQDGPIGFAPASRAAQKKAEDDAIRVPTPDAARAWLRSLTEEPHVAGTDADKKTADDVAEKLRSWGWQVEMAEYEVLLNYPEPPAGPYTPPTIFCKLVRPTEVDLKVREDAVVADKDSASPAAFPAFHGYGVSGDVTGQVVYANYGQPEDFAELKRLGIDVKGKIVLVRYGAIFRGLKIRNAQKLGAIGVLIYSDPLDDGYGKGDVFPNGPYRPGSSLQRGSVQFLSLGPGDPSTPFGPSIKGAKRLPIDMTNGLPLGETFEVDGKPTTWKDLGIVREDYFATIPSLPLSYDAAKPILEAMGGPNVPAGWQGGLPLPYHLGPGPAEVHFKVTMDYEVRTIWNVIATLPGTVEPDRWVMIGNHRDAWVYGAVDPGSGTAATLETCRAIGDAYAKGWRPRRTLKYASWDGEEYGLVGSTEWADEHSAEVDQKAVLLLNVDSAVSGPELDIDGVPSLRDLLLEAAGSVVDVRSNLPLRDIWLAKRRNAWAAAAPFDLEPLWDGNGNGNGSEDHAKPANGPLSRKFSAQMNPLGSGSDYTAFLDHLGVPSLDVGFNGRYGVYHSIYDDFFWMEKFGDPEFVTHATAARLYALVAMRAASAEVVPFRFVPYGEALREYVDDLRRMTIRKARAMNLDTPQPANFPIGLPKLVAAVKAFEAQAAALDAATLELAKRDGVPVDQLKKVNDAITKVERAFLLPKGLPGRPWFKHSIYAPGLTTGYSSWTLPGVRQGVQENKAEMVAEQLGELSGRIEAATQALKAATDAATVPNPAAPASPPNAAAPAASPNPNPNPATPPAQPNPNPSSNPSGRNGR